jgi:Protein of unknown function (DUF1549)/Protein of unknown function (DUF1553)
MAGFRRTRWVATGRFAVPCLALLTLPFTVFSQDAPREKSKQAEGKSAAPLSRGDALEIFAAIRNINDAARREEEAARSHRVAIKRPAKTVTPPTLTTADLDELVEHRVATEGAQPAPIADDATWLRRVSLDVAGRLPSPEESKAFAADQSANRRRAVVDRLLASDEYAKHWARYWTDVIRFRATFQQPRLVNFPALEAWLTEQLKENKPWDEVATQLISGVGRTDQAGQTVFAAAHLDGRQGISAPEFAGEVSRVFLGIQIQCAQCHNHPTDPWTREQFHQFAAFFAGTQGRRNGMVGQGDYGIEVVSPDRVPRYGMPDLEDPSQTIVVEPKFFLADAKAPTLSGLTTAERRELAASLVTGQDNPWFARAFVNRIWYELLGEAFTMPIDDLGPTREPVGAEIMNALADQWRAGGHDVQWLFRTILASDSYARQARSSDSTEGQASFASNCPSRLRADEIVSALQQALGIPQSIIDGDAPRAEMREMMAPPAGAPAGGMGMARPRFGPAQAINALFGVDPSTPDDEVLGTIPQALFLMNGPAINNMIGRRDGPLAKILAEQSNDADALTAVYLRVLSRVPNEEETKLCLDAIKAAGNRRQGFEDVYWALINSAEFLSRK